MKPSVRNHQSHVVVLESNWKIVDHFSANLRTIWRDDEYQNDPLSTVHVLTQPNFWNRKHFRFYLKCIFQIVIYVIQDNSDDERLQR